MKEFMRAAVLHGIGDLRVEKRPCPRLRAGQALVKVKACGLCGSDVGRVFRHGSYRFPLIIGHEFSGEVTATAEKGRWRIGDRATVYPLIPCRKCLPCEAGKPNLCEDYDYLGSRSDGGLAEFAAVPVENLVRIPQGVDFASAALTEPAAVALHGLKRVGLRQGETLAIFGAGPVGLLAAQIGRALGATKVVLADVLGERLELAGELGFEEVVLVGEEEEKWREYLPCGADIVVEASGASAALTKAIEVVGRGGRILLLGNPAGEMVLKQERYWALLRKEVSLIGSWNSTLVGEPNEWEMVLRMMAAGKIESRPMITHRLSLEEVVSGLELMAGSSGAARKREPHCKVMVVFGAR